MHFRFNILLFVLLTFAYLKELQVDLQNKILELSYEIVGRSPSLKKYCIIIFILLKISYF